MKKHKTSSANKGVTAISSDINGSTGNPSKVNSKDGIDSMKEELKNVIELMGPSTPHLTLTSSNEADNEDSLVSTSIYSSVLQVKQTSRRDAKAPSVDTPRDISEMSALPVDSEANEGSENVARYQPHNTQSCPCRQYYNEMRNNYTQCVNIHESQPNMQSRDSINLLNLQNIVDINKKNSKERVMSFLNMLGIRKQGKELTREHTDLYKINILQANDNNIPKRLTFDLVNDVPKPVTYNAATNTSKVRLNSPIYYPQIQQTPAPASMSNITVHIPQAEQRKVTQPDPIKFPVIEKPTRVDVYYFDHGNSAYLRTTDPTPTLSTEIIAEKTEAYTAKFWAEMFGTFHIAIAFVTTFLLQLLRFFLYSLVRPLTVGLMQLASDYFFKPFLTVCFNALIQPPAILLFNVLTSLRDLCDPIAEGLGYFLREIANVFRAIRLVEVRHYNRRGLSDASFRRSRLRRKK